MTSAITPPPMSPLEHRLQVAGQLDMARQLLPHLDDAGLGVLRAWLRHPDTRGVCADTQLAAVRADTLEFACRLLVEQGVGPLEYYQGTGDVLPAVPDDLSTLNEPGAKP